MYKDTIAMMAEDIGLKDEWMEQFLEQGRTESREESRIGILQSARNALAKGYNIETVHDITGLPMDEIAKL